MRDNGTRRRPDCERATRGDSSACMFYRAGSRNVKATRQRGRRERNLVALQNDIGGGQGRAAADFAVNCRGTMCRKGILSGVVALWHAECIYWLSINGRRRGGYFVSCDGARTTYPFVILSKLSPRYGDHAHHGILRVSRNQGS